MHGGFHDDDDNKGKKDVVDTASIREKVKLARSEKWRILKNIIVVSLAFMVQFTAFQVSNDFQAMNIYFEKNSSRELQICNHQSIRKIRLEQSHFLRFMALSSFPAFFFPLYLFAS